MWKKFEGEDGKRVSALYLDPKASNVRWKEYEAELGPEYHNRWGEKLITDLSSGNVFHPGWALRDSTGKLSYWSNYWFYSKFLPISDSEKMRVEFDQRRREWWVIELGVSDASELVDGPV